METNLWWIWFILAALFVVGEIFTAGFFLLWFGVGAAFAGLAALLGLTPVWQLAGFVVLSGFLLAISRKFAERVSREQPSGIGANRIVGATCVVLEEINNHENTGRVRMGTEEWRASSDTGAVLSPGEEVVVTHVSGTQVIVRPAT